MLGNSNTNSQRIRPYCVFSSLAIFAFRFSAHFMSVEPIIITYAIWIFSDILRGLRRMPLILLIVIVSTVVIPCKTASGLPDVQLDNAPLPIVPIAIAVSGAAVASAYSVANPPEERTMVPQKPKPKKRRKRPTAPRRKISTYNYAAAKRQLHLDPSASYNEFQAALKPVAGPILPNSPDKSQLKRESKMLRKKVDRKHARDSVTILNNNNDLKSMRKIAGKGTGT